MTLKKCLFCQTENDCVNVECSHCGMALPNKHPQDKGKKNNCLLRYLRLLHFYVYLWCTICHDSFYVKKLFAHFTDKGADY